MRAIIMCDGKAMRWYEEIQEKYWADTEKQLVEVDGEPILHRTVRLLIENGAEDIWITSHNPKFEVKGTKRYAPYNNQYEIDKFYACKSIWKTTDTTVFVYGDVFYTEEAMKKIVSIDCTDFLFYGIFHLSHFTGHGGEIFAVKVKDHDFFRENCEYIRMKHIYEKYRCSAWDLYRAMNGIRGEALGHHLPYAHFIGIDDFTDDFDTPEHYNHWLELYERSKC
jgi:GTP:adenosylcobinamide-phosphate guanylyltransferase